MIEVDDILSSAYPDLNWSTVLLATRAVEEALIEFSQTKDNPKNAFLDKLVYFAETGFEKWIGDKRPIRHEWDGIYRIGTDRSLFRIIGFFSNNQKNEFVAVDAFLKHGQKLSAPERKKIDQAAQIRTAGQWKRVRRSS